MQRQGKDKAKAKARRGKAENVKAWQGKTKAKARQSKGGRGADTQQTSGDIRSPSHPLTLCGHPVTKIRLPPPWTPSHPEARPLNHTTLRPRATSLARSHARYEPKPKSCFPFGSHPTTFKIQIWVRKEPTRLAKGCLDSRLTYMYVRVSVCVCMCVCVCACVRA